jgi:hypothetical protein
VRGHIIDLLSDGEIKALGSRFAKIGENFRSAE